MFCSQWFLTLFSYRWACKYSSRVENSLSFQIPTRNCFSDIWQLPRKWYRGHLWFQRHALEEEWRSPSCLEVWRDFVIFEYQIVRLLPRKVSIPFQLESQSNTSQIERSSDDSGQNVPKYMVDEFVNEATSLRITPFMLDCYRHEYEDLVVCSSYPSLLLPNHYMDQRETNKHAVQIDELRNSNRSLSNQV